MQPSTRLASLLLPFLAFLVCLAAAQIALASPDPGEAPPQTRLDELARAAVLGDEQAASALRAEGQAGVDALFDQQHLDLQSEDVDGLAGWERTLDRVCAQRFCRHSRLFWHTDFDAAVAEAEQSGRPILSLRLLGRLDEDRSCANSRFFRTVLYADPAVADELRERFVLHWSSERPVPKLTIDYGDGRRVEGTITGNSVHYVLDPHGRLVDALPGLYGPGLFRERLLDLADVAAKLQDAGRSKFLRARREHHLLRLATLRATSQASGWGALQPGGTALAGGSPSALDAASRAASKTAVEMKTVIAVDASPGAGYAPNVRWDLLAFERPDDWRLSQASRDLLLRTHVDSVRAVTGGEISRYSRVDVAMAAQRAIESFELTVGADTMRNEYDLHRQIHSRLAEQNARGDAEPGIERFNRWVYDELFLTPASDPWLGLWSPEVIAALAPIRQ